MAEPSPRVTVPKMGAPGADAGVTGLEPMEAWLSPMALIAVTVNE